MSGRQKSPTIIKRSARRSHSGGHGGAWKVAFADFMLALMSLFMVMWIMGQVSEKDRKAIMYTLNNTSIFDSHSFSPISFSGQPPAPAVSPDIAPQNAQASTAGTAPETNALSTSESATQKTAQAQQLQKALQAVMRSQQAQNNMRIEVLASGLRVVVNDDPHRAMFERGSARVTPYFQQLLTQLVPPLRHSGYHLMIIGHTDATPYPQNPYYDNWSLSVDRAQAARQVMLHAGLAGSQIIQLSGVADQKPMDIQQPTSGINRRIEFMLLSDQGMANWEQTFDAEPGKIPVSGPVADKP